MMYTTFFIYLLIYVIEATILLQYASYLFSFKHNILITGTTLLSLYAGLALISMTHNFVLNITAFLAANFLFISTMFKVKWNTALFHAAITTAVMGMSELVLYSIMPHFLPAFFAVETQFRNIVILTVFSKTLYLFILLIFSRVLCRSDKHSKQSAKTNLLLIAISAISIFVMATLFVICKISKLSASINWMVSISALFLLLNNILIFAVHSYTQNKNAEFTEMQLLLQKELDSAEYYKMLLEQNESQNVLIHDIKNHLNSIALLNANQECEKLAAYIDNIVHSVDFQAIHRFSDNELLNTILGRYQKQCMEKQIAFLVDIRKNTVAFLAEEDLTALFCNLLDNAIESALHMQEAYIDLHINIGDNTPFTILTLENSCCTSPFKNGSQELVTSKPNRLQHGYGLKSVRRIVKKYGGEMKMYYNDGTLSFHTIITLKR